MRNVRITGSFLAIVLAMALLGPAPAAVIGASASIVDAIIARRPLENALMNITNYVIFPLVGGRSSMRGRGAHRAGWESGFGFAALVLLVFMVTNFLNFTLDRAVQLAKPGGRVLAGGSRRLPNVLPSEFATGLLTAGAAYSYGQIGVGAVGLAAVVLFVVQYLFRTGVQAYGAGRGAVEADA